MESLQFIPNQGGFSLNVKGSGWARQVGFLWGAGIPLALAGMCTNGLIQTLKVNGHPPVTTAVVQATLLWAVGLTMLLWGMQRAYRKTVFVADAEELVIATSGPLGSRARSFVRASVLAVIAGESHVAVNGRQLKQLQLYLAGQAKPYCMFTGRDGDELACIARYMTQGLHLGSKQFSRDQFMEIRHAPIYARLFQMLCAIGVGVGLVDVALSSVIGNAACAAIFFGTVLGVIVIFFAVARKCKCPKCGAAIRRDSLSPEGYLQYTCPQCRVVWQSPIRAGGHR